MQEKYLNYVEFSDYKRSLRIHPRVLKNFKKYEQKEGDFEAGGILLGYVYKDYDKTVKVTTPNQLDSKGFFFFNRSKIPAQLQINRSWKRSRGSLIYLGEWHTHHEKTPFLSTVDENMIKKVLEETEMEIDFLYLILVGLNGTYWVGRQTTNGLIKLDLK